MYQIHKKEKKKSTLQRWIWDTLVKILGDYAHTIHQVGQNLDNTVNNVISQMLRVMFLFIVV